MLCFFQVFSSDKMTGLDAARGPHFGHVCTITYKQCYRVCHGFTKRDDCFWVTFVKFWSERHFLRQEWKSAWAWNQTTIWVLTKLSLSKSMIRTVSIDFKMQKWWFWNRLTKKWNLLFFSLKTLLNMSKRTPISNNGRHAPVSIAKQLNFFKIISL